MAGEYVLRLSPERHIINTKRPFTALIEGSANTSITPNRVTSTVCRRRSAPA